MVTATKKKPSKQSKARPKAAPAAARTQARSQPKATPKKAPKPAPPQPDPLDDIEEPDRSSPALAEVDAEALEFIAAIDRFKKENGRPFPSWSEVLLVLRQLGYKRA